MEHVHEWQQVPNMEGRSGGIDTGIDYYRLAGNMVVESTLGSDGSVQSAPDRSKRQGKVNRPGNALCKTALLELVDEGPLGGDRIPAGRSVVDGAEGRERAQQPKAGPSQEGGRQSGGEQERASQRASHRAARLSRNFWGCGSRLAPRSCNVDSMHTLAAVGTVRPRPGLAVCRPPPPARTRASQRHRSSRGP